MRLPARLQHSSVARSAVALAVVLFLATCSSPTDPPTPPDGESPPPGGEPPPSPMTELVLAFPSTMTVHASVLLLVTGRTADGAVVEPPYPILYTTSDTSIATVSSMGVVFAENRGTVTITASSGSVHGSLTVTVRARVAVVLGEGYTVPLALPNYYLAVGDTLSLQAAFVDIDGEPIEGTPAVTWSSSNPPAVSVDENGRVIALQPLQSALVTASTADGGLAWANVVVDSTQAGLPATVRFAHAAPGVGPVTFRPIRGEPVTLSVGQSVDVAVGSGIFSAKVDGLPAGQSLNPSDWTELIRPGASLSLFVVGGTSAYLVPLYGPSPVVADSGMVRLVQGSDYLVVHLQATGAPVDGTPELCYFDPGSPTEYFIRPAGRFDLVLERKYQANDFARLPADAPAGRPVTLVLTGSSAETAGYLAFPDP